MTEAIHCAEETQELNIFEHRQVLWEPEKKENYTETGHSCKASAACISLVLQSTSSVKSQDTLYHVLRIGSAEICPNPSEVHITHSFRGVQWPKNLSYLFSFSPFLPLTYKFNLLVNPSPNPSLYFRGGGQGASPPMPSLIPFLMFYSPFWTFSPIQSQ